MSAPESALPYRRTRTMTSQAIDDYPVALETAAAGLSELAVIGANIHTDEEFARANGHPGRIADGMIIGNWLYQAVLGVLGPEYLERGRFRVKFIRPVFVDDEISLVIEPDPASGPSVAAFLLRAERQNGEICVVGSASLPVDGPAQPSRVNLEH